MRVLLSLLVLVLVAGAVALRRDRRQRPGDAGQRPGAREDFDAAGAAARRSDRAPPLALHNYLGQPVNIDSYRGKAVLVTFLYTNCPDICPLITSNLRVALNLMGPAKAAKSAGHRRLGRPQRRHPQGRRARSSRATR